MNYTAPVANFEQCVSACVCSGSVFECLWVKGECLSTSWVSVSDPVLLVELIVTQLGTNMTKHHAAGGADEEVTHCILVPAD